jgi:hypothetical protein
MIKMTEIERKAKAKILSQIIGAIKEHNFDTASQINGYLQSLSDYLEGES